MKQGGNLIGKKWTAYERETSFRKWSTAFARGGHHQKMEHSIGKRMSISLRRSTASERGGHHLQEEDSIRKKSAV